MSDESYPTLIDAQLSTTINLLELKIDRIHRLKKVTKFIFLGLLVLSIATSALVTFGNLEQSNEERIPQSYLLFYRTIW